MKIKKISLQRYKRILDVEIDLSDVNVLVGSNNSGKSSVLQGIHFAITVATTARQQGQSTFASDLLPYNPTPDFSILRNGAPYLNHAGSGDSNLKLYSDFIKDDETSEESFYSITLYKGRNHGNIGCNREGDYPRLGAEITDAIDLYSIYVPGLAGIAQHEELRAKAIVRRGVASGDANLYLRNIIYYIEKSNKLEELNSHLSTIFPGVSVKTEFDEDKDYRLNVQISSPRGKYPIELSGTGLLQVLQIYSYITYFSPKLLLLDEPDSHLHPDNQAELCQAITEIAQTKKCQILLCTHSRHVVEEFSGSANFIWLKDGTVQQQGTEIEKLPLLLDLGALDSFDKLRSGQTRLLILTEDRDKNFLEFLLIQNGYLMNEVLVYSYKTSSNLEGAILFVEFLVGVAPLCKVMIHRDRDFMTQEESTKIENNIRESGAIPFITRGSDIESYFTSASHLRAACEITEEEASNWLNELATKYHNELQLQLTRKRDDIKSKMYRTDKSSCPDTLQLIGQDIPLPESKRKGKFMLSKIRGDICKKIGRAAELKVPSQNLYCLNLQQIKNEVWPAM